jgi:hypothetical protein
VDVTVAVERVLGGDLKDGITGNKGIQTEKLAELLLTGLAVGINGGQAVPTERGRQGVSQPDMVR